MRNGPEARAGAARAGAGRVHRRLLIGARRLRASALGRMIMMLEIFIVLLQAYIFALQRPCSSG